ncbi:hypothetical protein PoB_004641500 [Plakobranchus ocellatus]|uniref:Uncharacterized protein n=1 Tax=Plakobranchus ocellatus TaxID=259542 RepID=A0AAV4BKA4_9GAST|nr:hypothetical protein PoB_004641500 [Plakobranchus ocellatus]
MHRTPPKFSSPSHHIRKLSERPSMWLSRKYTSVPMPSSVSRVRAPPSASRVGSKPVHNKVISGFRALRRAGARTRDRGVPAYLTADTQANLPPTPSGTPATEGSLQMSGRVYYQLCYRRPN